MLKAIKNLDGNPNQIKNQIELQRIVSSAKIDRTESCFAGKSQQTQKQHLDSNARAAKIASDWF